MTIQEETRLERRERRLLALSITAWALTIVTLAAMLFVPHRVAEDLMFAAIFFAIVGGTGLDEAKKALDSRHTMRCRRIAGERIDDAVPRQ